MLATFSVSRREKSKNIGMLYRKVRQCFVLELPPLTAETLYNKAGLMKEEKGGGGGLKYTEAEGG